MLGHCTRKNVFQITYFEFEMINVLSDMATKYNLFTFAFSSSKSTFQRPLIKLNLQNSKNS